MTDVEDRVFVTGVAGLIGSNIARAIHATGRTVIGIDNLWRGAKRNIQDLAESKRFQFRHADVATDHAWYRDMNSSDRLIHVADIVAGIGYVFSNEWGVFQKNLAINSSVARIANEVRPQQLIYLGTACSYPKELQRSVESSKLSERQKFPADPESGYGWSKLIGEIEFRLAVSGSETKLTVLDLHNVYGWPCIYNDVTAQVIPALIYRALKSKDGKLHVWGNGRQGRAFLHVSDVVSAVIATLEYVGREPTFMIGPDFCTTIGEIARLIQLHPKVKIRDVVFDPSKPTGDIGRYADSGLARVELGWMPRVGIADGVAELIDRIVADGR